MLQVKADFQTEPLVISPYLILDWFRLKIMIKRPIPLIERAPEFHNSKNLEEASSSVFEINYSKVGTYEEYKPHTVNHQAGIALVQLLFGFFFKLNFHQFYVTLQGGPLRMDFRPSVG